MYTALQFCILLNLEIFIAYEIVSNSFKFNVVCMDPSSLLFDILVVYIV